MNLKEAFRYQNKLSEWFDTTIEYLSYDSNVTKKTQQHLRKKANPQAEDETVDTTKDREYDVPVTTIVNFAEFLLNQKSTLFSKISEAKNTCGMDIDGSVATNKKRQEMNSALSRMSNIKSSEKIILGQSYMLNVAGDQVPYRYDIKEVSTIDFDRNVVKGIAKKLIKKSDEVSNDLDKIMIDTLVDYEPIYDVNDTYSDILEQFNSNSQV